MQIIATLLAFLLASPQSTEDDFVDCSGRICIDQGMFCRQQTEDEYSCVSLVELTTVIFNTHPDGVKLGLELNSKKITMSCNKDRKIKCEINTPIGGCNWTCDRDITSCDGACNWSD